MERRRTSSEGPADGPPGRPPGGRRFTTRWAVLAFVVLALVVSVAVMVWQSRGEPPEHTDVGLDEPAGDRPALVVAAQP